MEGGDRNRADRLGFGRVREGGEQFAAEYLLAPVDSRDAIPSRPVNRHTEVLPG
jgi:hypothetical protein